MTEDTAEEMTLSNLSVVLDFRDLRWGDLKRFVQLAIDNEVADGEEVQMKWSAQDIDVPEGFEVVLSRKADRH